MGSGSEPYSERTVPLGRWLARRGVHLLTGGGNGVMEAVSRAFYQVKDRIGHVIGVLPAFDLDASHGPKPGYPNPWVEIPIRTHLPYSGTRGTDHLSRNHINILTADVIVALPGGAGTASEVALCLRYKKPIIAFLKKSNEIPDLPSTVRLAETLGEVQDYIFHVLARISH